VPRWVQSVGPRRTLCEGVFLSGVTGAGSLIPVLVFGLLIHEAVPILMGFGGGVDVVLATVLLFHSLRASRPRRLRASPSRRSRLGSTLR
jgi:hypothetical protein